MSDPENLSKSTGSDLPPAVQIFITNQIGSDAVHVHVFKSLIFKNNHVLVEVIVKQSLFLTLTTTDTVKFVSLLLVDTPRARTHTRKPRRNDVTAPD